MDAEALAGERVPEEEPGLVLNVMEVAFIYAFIRSVVPDKEAEDRCHAFMMQGARDTAESMEIRHLLTPEQMQVPTGLIPDLKRACRAFLVEVIGEEGVAKMERDQL